MPAAKWSNRIQRLWDSGAAHVGRHPRKYQAAGFAFIFLPQWAPAARDATAWLWSLRPGWMTVPTLSWEWVTAPVGLFFIILAWWESRRYRVNPPRSSAPLDGRPSGIPTTSESSASDTEPSANSEVSEVSAVDLTPPAAAGDLFMSFVPFGNLSLIEVRTTDPEGVSDVTLTVLSFRRWSEANPRGWCKAPQFENAPKPVRLTKHGGENVLYVHAPWTFALLGEKQGQGWSLPYRPYKGSAANLHLPFGRWKADVELSSRGESRVETFCFKDAPGQSSESIDPSTV